MSGRASPPAPSAVPAARAWRVALTGGIASGKSTVAALFAQLGVAVIDADVVAREVQAAGTPLLQQIFAQFGDDLRLPDGNLNRSMLRQRIFSDAAQRRQLEALVQPAIGAPPQQLAAQASGHYLIYVIPLLAETRSQSRFDRVLVIDCPEALQLQRLQARDGCDLQQARAILAAQASRDDRLALADDVVVNDRGEQALQHAVDVLHEKYRSLTGPQRSQKS